MSDSPAAAPPPGFTLEVLLSEDDWAEHLRDETLAGLREDPPSTPPVWFYDAAGSELFDKITLLDEYYPTRAERAILAANSDEIAAFSGANSLIELGAGSADKTRLLLQGLADTGTLQRYVPVDCSEPALVDAGIRVNGEFPGLPVEAIVADFNAHLPHFPRGDRRMIAFLGSTIGNFVPPARAAFLNDVAEHLATGDTLLLGTDLVKSPERLVAAYNDAAGVTADFNRNSMAVMNRQLGADFDIDQFRHDAVWNEPESRIEMRLVADSDQRVVFEGLGGHAIEVLADAWIRTEISVKFTKPQVAAELSEAGLDVAGQWTDPDGDFLLTLASKPK